MDTEQIVPTGKGHIYYLGYSAPGPGNFKHKVLKNFGTTLPSDKDIVAAVGTTPGCYLVESVRGKEKILKSYANIAALVGTIKPEDGGYTQEELDALGDNVTDIMGKVLKGRR